jgi:uncharacterized protein YceK
MKRLLLILMVLTGIIVLGGCSIVFDCCTPPTQQCYLIITAGDYVWGIIYVNDQSTGQYIDYLTQPTVTVSVPCAEYIKVYIMDTCNDQSYTEHIFINPGKNYLHFPYWTEGYIPWW